MALLCLDCNYFRTCNDCTILFPRLDFILHLEVYFRLQEEIVLYSIANSAQFFILHLIPNSSFLIPN